MHGATLAILGGLFLPTATAAQEPEIPPVRYPVLPAAAARAEGFVPAGWAIERRAQGDLNGDGVADLALVLRSRDPRNIIRHDDLGENPFDTNPRILAVALATPRGQGYRLAVQNHSLIGRRDNSAQLDPFGEEDGRLAIERGTLRLSLHLFMSAGGWTMANYHYTFRWQGNALRLVGYDSNSVQRNSGEAETLSVNYLTRRVRTATGSIESEAQRVRWTRLRPGPLLTIEQVGYGLDFDPLSRPR